MRSVHESLLRQLSVTDNTEIVPLISVITPVLNEGEIIGRNLSPIEDEDRVEVLVGDGGCSDETLKRVEASGAARVIKAEACGRANQMNAGAESAGGDILLFLHADCKLPEDT